MCFFNACILIFDNCDPYLVKNVEGSEDYFWKETKPNSVDCTRVLGNLKLEGVALVQRSQKLARRAIPYSVIENCTL